ncbi:16855_t:CDS:2 [Cetraspora pellucida]|uniref:16855_t:CDS:1 n=1 Tax=Cetraspora pellucida TaxID=1433469 RepID=A0A9N9CHC2_9GLOM|nr:16855_t:CDS:2 [Cetraspora pellucida]
MARILAISNIRYIGNIIDKLSITLLNSNIVYTKEYKARHCAFC